MDRTIPRYGGAAPWIFAILVGMAGPLAGAEDVVFRFDGPLVGTERLPEPWKLLGHPTADPPTFTAEEDPVHGKVIRVHAKGNQADAIYRSAPPRLRNVSIFCDSNDSDSEAIGYCAPITFSSEPLHNSQDTP